MGRFGISLIVAGILTGVAACSGEQPAPAAEPAAEAAPPAVGDTAVPAAEAPAPEAAEPAAPADAAPAGETAPDPQTLIPDNE